MVKYLLALLLLSFTINAETTGNLLTNSNFSDGLNGWTNHGTTQQHHNNFGNECSGSAVDTVNSGCGTTGSLATLDNGGVSQTIKLSETTTMTSLDMQNGFSSEMSSDVWFWHGTDTVTMTQTVTGNNGDINTQSRVVTGNHNNYQTYTDTIIIGNNTATDFDINAKLDIDDSANCSGHCGPDIDNVEVKVTYDVIPPLSEDVQEDLNDIVINDDFIDDIILDEIIWDFEEITFDEALVELENLDFEETIILTNLIDDFEEFDFGEIELEEFEDIALEDLEEIDFTEFEDIDFEEFEEIIAEAEIEEFEDVEEIEDVEVAEEDAIEIEEENEIEIAEEPEEIINDTVEEETAQAEVLEDEIEEAEDIEEAEEIEEIEEEIETVEEIDDVEEIESEEIEVVNKDIKIDVNDKIEVKVAEITLFSNSNALDVYKTNDFYKPQNIYQNVDDALFIQTDLGAYYKDIYIGVTLDNYINSDPIGQRNQKLYDLKVEKLKILIDLKKLKGLL